MTEDLLPPSIEERLTAAAFEILTDDNRHTRGAKDWATGFIREAALGRPTAFLQSLSRHARETLQ